jgi:hypothetical protein
MTMDRRAIVWAHLIRGMFMKSRGKFLSPEVSAYLHFLNAAISAPVSALSKPIGFISNFPPAQTVADAGGRSRRKSAPSAFHRAPGSGAA